MLSADCRVLLSKRKQDSFFLQSLELLRQEGIETRGLAAGAAPFFQWFQNPQQAHFLAKVALVEFAAQHGFIERLQLRQTEFPRQELKAGSCVLQLVTQAFERAVHDPAMIEGERRELRDRPPLCSCGIASRM